MTYLPPRCRPESAVPARERPVTYGASRASQRRTSVPSAPGSKQSKDAIPLIHSRNGASGWPQLDYSAAWPLHSHCPGSADTPAMLGLRLQGLFNNARQDSIIDPRGAGGEQEESFPVISPRLPSRVLLVHLGSLKSSNQYAYNLNLKTHRVRST